MYFTLSLVLIFLPRVGVQLVGSAFCFLPVDISHVFVCFSHFLLIILDCYEEYLRDRCPMSYINSSRGAMLARATGDIVPSRNNCEYVLHGYAVSVRTTRVVLPSSELLACYGPSYTDYV